MRRIRLVALGAAGGLLAAVVVVLSGALDVASSSPLSSLSEWVQRIAVRQSVTLRSIGIVVPDLDDDAMVRRGAGHYALVCATCHGSPAGPPSAVARDMVPEPPLLVDQMAHWRPEARVFWTVKHGVRFSAMPAFPTQVRDDEVWALVAFLRKMPDLSRQEYTQLAGLGAATTCERCHGDGEPASDAAFPRLDIQSAAYIASTLKAFRARHRASAPMIAAAAQLSDGEIDALALQFGKQTEAAVACDGPALDLVMRGDAERGIPSCASCHGAEARQDFPRLEGQRFGYLMTQLQLFADLGVERGGPHAGIMAQAIRNVPHDLFPALAACYASEP